MHFGSSKVTDMVIARCTGLRFWMHLIVNVGLLWYINLLLFFVMAHPRCNSMSQARECRISVDSDEDIERGFSCLINQKETGIPLE